MEERPGKERCRGKVLTFRPKEPPNLEPFEVVNIPLLELVPKLDPSELKEALERSEAIVFTSVTGVEVVREKAPELFNEIKNKEVFAIGPKTAKALSELGIEAKVPPEYTSDGLARVLEKYGSVVAVRSDKASSVLRQLLGSKLKEVIAYSTVRVKRREVVDALSRADAVVISSAEIARALLESLRDTGSDPKEVLNQVKVVAIGRFAAKPLEEAGVSYYLAEEATFEGVRRKLLELLC